MKLEVGEGGGGLHLLVIFCGRHKRVTSKTIISKIANTWNRNASNLPEILITRHTVI